MQGTPLANGTEKHTDTDWNSIDWHQEEQRVRNLRQRIFRATQAGDWKRVRSLQKLMLRSRANRLTSVRRVAQLKKWRDVHQHEPCSHLSGHRALPEIYGCRSGGCH